MIKLTFLCLFMSMTFLGSLQSASFDCSYKYGYWDPIIGSIYYCIVDNSVSITSQDAAQVDSINGTHIQGFNDDNVEGFQVNGIGQIHYFPRGLNKFFKNLKGIEIVRTGLKEVHQSDLKDYPELESLYMPANDLEVLDANLFEFNPNLGKLYLHSCKISHIGANVFGNLTKLRIVDINSNPCIDTYAFNNATELQILIKTAKTQCSSLDYSNLDQQVKNLEIESQNLTSKQLKKKLQNLEIEVKNSKFSNTFHRQLQDLKAAQVKKAQYEASQTTSTSTPQAPTTTTKRSGFEGCSVLESKVERLERKIEEQNQKFEEIGESLKKIMKALDIGG